MTHPTADELLLLAYGELLEPLAATVESHLASCAACRADFARLDSARVALDIASPPRRRSGALWIAAGLAAAAALAAVVLTSAPSRPAAEGWRPASEWSATAGYVAGGRAAVEIDAQLTRLEQRGVRYYGLPN